MPTSHLLNVEIDTYKLYLLKLVFIMALLPINIITATDCSCTNNSVVVGEEDDPASLTFLSKTTLINASNTFSNGCLILHGKLIVDVDYVFDNVQVIANEGAEILVGGTSTNGVGNVNTLTIQNGSLLHGCEKMWRGLTVDRASHLFVKNSKVCDAQYAIRLERGSEVKLHNNEFLGNYVSVFVPYPDINNGTSTIVDSYGEFIKDNLFDQIEHYKEPYTGQYPHPGSVPYAAFFVERITHFRVGHSFSNKDTIKNAIQNIRNGVIDIGGTDNRYYGLEIKKMVDDTVSSQLIEGYGFYLENSKRTRIYRNSIEDSRIGVFMVDYDKCIIYQNAMKDIGVHGVQLLRGINTSGSIFKKAANVNANTIMMSENSAAIQIIQNELDSRPIEVTENSIQAKSGIAIEEIQGQVQVTLNRIIADSIDAGILLNNTAGTSLVESNYIHDTAVESDNDGGGIILNNSSNGQINGNTVIASDHNSFAIGISVFKSQNLSYCCNTLHHSIVGVRFFGDCQNTSFANTSFGTHAIGLQLVNAKISPQYNSGNNWIDGNCFLDAQYLGSPDDIIFSTFQTDDDLLTDGLQKVWTPNGVAKGDWFKFKGMDPTCSDWDNCGQVPFDELEVLPGPTGE